ncbi:hypothetical protein [Mycobacterium sp. SMC-13]|uniref:hypothetical protein n=1 Tax=Mycobacterium sp. SMC-13 TaxID=3381626 RepID=UPI003877163A
MIDSTTRGGIVQALSSWDRAAVAGRVAEADELQHQFIQRFPVAKWPALPLEEYALGQGAQDTVSWWMEYKTGPVGSIKGGSAHKHLIFLARNGSWRFPKEYESVDRAWAAVREGFVEMLDLGANGQFDDADDIKVLTGAPALRTKLLYMYYPDGLLPVFSKAHIDHYLHALGEAPASSVVRANRQLLDMLRAVPELAELTNHQLGIFLYHWNNPRPSQRVVKIAPGERGAFWDDCRKNGYICVGWDEVGDLAQYENKDAFKDAFREHYPYNRVERQVSRKANELWTLTELQPGDTVIANRGTTEILAVGTVNDTGYLWRPEREQYKHTVGVDWDTSKAAPIEPVRAWATTTVSKVPATLLRRLLGGGGTTEIPVETDTIYLDLESALGRRGQAVLYGPPGTGKTYIGRRAAVWLLEGGSQGANALLSDEALLAARERALSTAPDTSTAARLTRVTFHPSYAYEDFIEGFRPQQTDSGTMHLVLTDGVFKRVCDTAREESNCQYLWIGVFQATSVSVC